MQRIPGNPFRGVLALERAYDHLRRYHGVPPHVTGHRLHLLKAIGGLAPDDDVVIGKTGDVYNALDGSLLGSLTDRTLGTGE